ncbi:SRPBCC domain-containing protein [Rhodococcus sp. G-MC3]|uniref:SRPBCC domain-containing protein n=1 Tax=Rhodococcus sp. G-MC3 TaxID=3046209 RepID=UPI0024BB1181|nr:SRPBCC domain-containing protein [Rhodococcus sp. G-MC3]MDJ0393463.1 SRPBCC domain-containing protein [Rhodococcus sp. G-MC3]
MEYASIERELHIDASPEVVFDVISSAEHLKQWWPDDAHFETAPGSTGELVFGDKADPDAHITAFTVLEVDAPRKFVFRWTNPVGEVAEVSNSLLVTFEVSPAESGSTVRMTETGFREQGWEIAVLEHEYNQHVHGWSVFLPRIAPYAESLSATR